MGGAAKTSPGQAASSIPLPTTIRCAGSWPDPEPWMIETLSSLGASARMMRLYSGTYLSVPELASAMPLSISGTNSLGLLTNFFTSLPPLVSHCSAALCPLVGKRLEHDRYRDAARVQRPDAPLAGISGTAALGQHRPGCLGLRPRRDRCRPERLGRALPLAHLLLDRVHRGHKRVEQGLVAYIGLAARLDPLDRGP